VKNFNSTDGDRSETNSSRTPRRTQWRSKLIRDSNRNARPVLSNAATALRHAPEWEGVLAYDEFSLCTRIYAQPPWGGAGSGEEWSDHSDRLVAEWLQHQGIFVSTAIASEAVALVSRDRTIHPVRDYLNGLTWDGQDRLRTWLATYLGADHSALTTAFGARWMVAAVARVLDPGVKSDSCLILEGAQGIGKSSALRILGSPWYTDDLPDVVSKDAAIQLRGVWIVEISELASFYGIEASKIKAFISRQRDRYRPPYGKSPIEVPRQCVFSGTVNQSVYLRDETGGRRFWPVECHHLLRDELERDRDQLWAEAVHYYRQGFPWWLDTPELLAEAEGAQRQRFQEDVWEERIGVYVQGKDWVTIGQVLTSALDLSEGVQGQAQANRVARILQVLGWKRTVRRIAGKRTWGYSPEAKGEASCE